MTASAAANSPHAALREDLQHAKALRDDDLINEEEFAGMKEEALAQFNGTSESP